MKQKQSMHALRVSSSQVSKLRWQNERLYRSSTNLILFFLIILFSLKPAKASLNPQLEASTTPQNTSQALDLPSARKIDSPVDEQKVVFIEKETYTAFGEFDRFFARSNFDRFEIQEDDVHNETELDYTKNSTDSHRDSTSNFFFISFIRKHSKKIVLGTIFYSLTVWTIFGNILVLIALFTNRQLKQGGMSNYLIGNLALSDLLLGVTVLPYSATFSTFKNWYFGIFMCDFWLAIDVLCCTASIWGLLVISLDRYIATNHPIRYRKQKNSVKIAIIYCTISWTISLMISIPPFFIDVFLDKGVQEQEFTTVPTALLERSDQPAQPHKKKISKNVYVIDNSTYDCFLYQKPSFVIMSSLGSFYIPLFLMIVLYSRVFLKIREQTRKFKEKDSSSQGPKRDTTSMTLSNIKSDHLQVGDRLLKESEQQKQQPGSLATAPDDGNKQKESILSIQPMIDQEMITNISSTSKTSKTSLETNKNMNGSCYLNEVGLTTSDTANNIVAGNTSITTINEISRVKKDAKNRRSLSALKNLARKSVRNQNTVFQTASSEARVTKTLAIIITCFVACWAPFFIVYIIRSQLEDAGAIPDFVMEFIIWLGYTNSAINPILYALLNLNFRKAFKDILTCKCFFGADDYRRKTTIGKLIVNSNRTSLAASHTTLKLKTSVKRKT